jgi:hypothetical protein
MTQRSHWGSFGSDPDTSSVCSRATRLSYAAITRLRPIAGVELGQQLTDVRLHGGRAHNEATSDLGIRQAACDETKHLDLSFGEACEISRR